MCYLYGPKAVLIVCRLIQFASQAGWLAGLGCPGHLGSPSQADMPDWRLPITRSSRLNLQRLERQLHRITRRPPRQREPRAAVAVAVHHPQPVRQLAAPLPRGTRRLCLLAASCLRCGRGRSLGCCLQLGLVQLLQLEPQPDPPRPQTNLRDSTTKQQAPLSYGISRHVTCVLCSEMQPVRY